MRCLKVSFFAAGKHVQLPWETAHNKRQPVEDEGKADPGEKDLRAAHLGLRRRLVRVESQQLAVAEGEAPGGGRRGGNPRGGGTRPFDPAGGHGLDQRP